MMAKVKASGTVHPTLQAGSSIMIMVISPATIGGTKSSSLARKKRQGQILPRAIWNIVKCNSFCIFGVPQK